MQDPRKLQTEYDFVVIVDGLEPQERTDWAVTNDLLDTLEALQIDSDPRYVHDAASLLSTLDELRITAVAGKQFQMHFVIHGDDTGIGFNPTGEVATWQQLTPALRDINAAMQGRLVLNMSSCEGLHGIKVASGQPFPFFGLVGSIKKLTIDEAKRVNRRFYELQSTGLDFNRVVEQVNAECGDILDLISAHGYDSYRKK